MPPENESGVAVQIHQPCTNPSCGSSDAMSIYADGGTFCFVCRHATRAGTAPAPGEEPAPRNMELLHVTYPSQGLPKRKLEPETLKKFSYGVSESRGVHVAQYRDASGTIVAQKLRTAARI